jgi:hypothetical protein
VVHVHAQVDVAGSWADWVREPLHWNGSQFEQTITLERDATYQYKYVVNDAWKCREDEPKAWDASGNMNNQLQC